MSVDVTDNDVQRAWQDLHRPRTTHPVADMHGFVQQFGQTGVILAPPLRAIMVITKPARLVSWTLDSLQVGTCGFTLWWSNWSKPRVWQDLVGTGTAPNLVDVSNASGDVTDWQPVDLDRRQAILIEVTTAINIEQLTLTLFVRELPRDRLGGP